MHQAILARAARNPESIAKARLRLIRSSSASLPPQVMREVEAAFGCPVIESYGMTEAAHQMTSNPLPPRDAFPAASAWPPARWSGRRRRGPLRAGRRAAEVVISGPNVTPATRATPTRTPRTSSRRTGGRWFRTGDQGVIDEGGYLRITGRLKEIINRGGEKVSPLEVDEVLMDHPAVQQVVTFAMPHDKLGEEVAAAVVLREGERAGGARAARLRGRTPRRLQGPAPDRRPGRDPEGATGKLQRIGLAQKLGLG
jgi:acyl-CoA synthetase (AMP-forming)/AMP-acid ligase II